MDTFLIAAGAASLLALIFAFVKFTGIMKQDAGSDRMQDISRQVQEGAAAFLSAEYKWLAVFVVVVAIAIGVSPSDSGLGPRTAISFICGALASALAGWFGMYTATRAAVRTTQAARGGLMPALSVSFSSGVVMGMSVVGLALLGVVIFTTVYSGGEGFSAKVLEHVLGFSFGASSIALFARVGGGIFTKAADVGADLVGKVEAGIPGGRPPQPRHHRRQRGRQRRRRRRYGRRSLRVLRGLPDRGHDPGGLPLRGAGVRGQSSSVAPRWWRGLGILASIVGTFFVRANSEEAVHNALFRGLIVASILVTIACSSSPTMQFPEGVEGLNLFGAIAGRTRGGRRDRQAHRVLHLDRDQSRPEHRRAVPDRCGHQHHPRTGHGDGVGSPSRAHPSAWESS